MLVDVLNALDLHTVDGGQDRGQHRLSRAGRTIQKEDLLGDGGMAAEQGEGELSRSVTQENKVINR